MGTKDTKVANERVPRRGDNSRNSSQKLDRRHDPMRGSSFLSVPQPVGDEALAGFADAFHAQRRSRAVSKQPFPTIAVSGVDGDASRGRAASASRKACSEPTVSPVCRERRDRRRRPPCCTCGARRSCCNNHDVCRRTRETAHGRRPGTQDA